MWIDKVMVLHKLGIFWGAWWLGYLCTGLYICLGLFPAPGNNQMNYLFCRQAMPGASKLASYCSFWPDRVKTHPFCCFSFPYKSHLLLRGPITCPYLSCRQAMPGSTLHLLGYDHERGEEDDEAQCKAQREIMDELIIQWQRRSLKWLKPHLLQ